MYVLVVALPWFKLDGLCSSEEKKHVEDLCIWRCSTVAVKDLFTCCLGKKVVLKM